MITKNVLLKFYPQSGKIKLPKRFRKSLAKPVAAGTAEQASNEEREIQAVIVNHDTLVLTTTGSIDTIHYGLNQYDERLMQRIIMKLKNSALVEELQKIQETHSKMFSADIAFTKSTTLAQLQPNTIFEYDGHYFMKRNDGIFVFDDNSSKECKPMGDNTIVNQLVFNISYVMPS